MPLDHDPQRTSRPRPGAACLPADPPTGCHRSARPIWGAGGGISGAGDPRADRSRNARDSCCRRAGGGPVCWVCPAPIAVWIGPLFEDWLSQHAPTKKAKILSRIRAMWGGKLNDARFGVRMQGEGVFAEQIASLFTLACRKAGLGSSTLRLSTTAFRRPAGPQLSLFP